MEVNVCLWKAQCDSIYILLSLCSHRGPDWDTHMEEDRRVPVKDLLVELYEKVRSFLNLGSQNKRCKNHRIDNRESRVELMERHYGNKKGIGGPHFLSFLLCLY